MERKTSGILADSTELKKLISDHPDYPIAVVCSEDVNCGDYSWMYASDIRFSVGEILDCEQPVDDCRIYNDRDDFEEDLEEWLWDYMCDKLFCDGPYDDGEPSEEEFQKKLKEEIAKYDPYWKDCIIIYADN